MTANIKDLPVRRRLRLLLADAVSELKPPPSLVADLLSAGSLVLLYGESNTGKSTVAMDLGMAIATGSPWRGMHTRRGAVLHVAGEGLYGLAARLRAYHQQTPHTHGAAYGIVAGEIDLLSPGDAADLLAAIADMQSETGEHVSMVILDTLARCAILDENDGAQMRLLIGACDRIRSETGATVVIVHHAGKDTSRGARGHSSLRAAVDTELLIEGRENPRTLTVTKQRDLPTAQAMAFTLEPVTIGQNAETNTAITACVVSHKGDAPRARRGPSGKAQVAILRALRNRQSESTTPLVWTLPDLRKIGRDLGQHRNTASAAVDGLVCSGFLIPTVGGHRLAEDTH